MTLSGNGRRERGKAYKQARLDRQDRQNARFPWLIPAIAILAVVIVVVGLVIAASLGHLF
ncbi:MAG TPA: hypothetical protein VGM70_10530 [Pseudolysinimonas sp.]|jgi:t-SNARE complex subunit (syntaxin)